MATFTEYLPHPAQVAIHRAKDKRFRTVCTGRRFGKTLCLAGELLDWGRRYGGEYGWVAPTYNVAERGIEAFRSVACEVVQVCGRAPSRVEFTGKAGPVRIWFLSADNADAIRGYGFDGLVIDEAASIPVDVWNYVLRPTISQTLGWAIFVSTPKGRNWFYDMFTRGQDPNERDYASFRFASNASPFFPQAEWEEARRTLPEDVFRQEYMAEFLEDSAGVFRGIDACLIRDDLTTKDAKGAKEEYHRSVVIGCDLAKHTDWTVLVAMDATTGRCFAMERFNHLEWPIQKERIVAFARRWHGRVILDATGVGDPIYDDLKRVLPDIEPFVVTVGSKVEVVQRLVVAIEQRQVSWPAGSAGRGGGGAAGGVGGGVGGGLSGGECGGFRGAGVTDRAVKVARDVGPSAALSRDDATTRLASSAPSGGQTDLTHDFAAGAPVRDPGGHRAEYGASTWGGDVAKTSCSPRRDEGREGGRGTTDGTDGTDWGVLTAELKRFEYEIGAGGRISYGAPSGYHDDCVMALALANHGRWQRSGMGTMVVLGVGDARWGWRRHRARREGRGENRAI